MDKATVETYNKLAESYDRQTIDFWDRFPKEFLDTFIKQAKSPVLDLGCGPGRDGLLLQNNGLTVIGLDASSSMVALSLARGLPTVMGDALHLPFPDKSLGAIWSYTTLIHIKKSDMAAAHRGN